MVAPLVERLATIQGALGHDDEAMGALCGMKSQMWRLVKQGQYGLSRRALGAILRSFPGLTDDVVNYLREDTSTDLAA